MRAYLRQHLSDFGNQWRSRRCSFKALWNVSSRALPSGWGERRGSPTCGHCLSFVHHIRRHLTRLEVLKSNELGQLSSFLPPLERVTSHLAGLFQEAMSEHNSDCKQALAKLQANRDAADCIAILSGRKTMDIPVAIDRCTYRLFECQSADCVQLIVKIYRSDNDLFCHSCNFEKRNAARSERQKKERGEADFALDSRTNLCHFDIEQLSQRGKLFYRERKRQEREIIRLRKELENLKAKVKRTEMVFDGSQANAFLRDACDKAFPSNAPTAGQPKNFVPNSDKSDELEKA